MAKRYVPDELITPEHYKINVVAALCKRATDKGLGISKIEEGGARVMHRSTLLVATLSGDPDQKSTMIFLAWKSCSSQRMLMRSTVIRTCSSRMFLSTIFCSSVSILPCVGYGP